MSIDVRFIQQLPATFIDQDTQNGQPGMFRFIRNADSNHDGNLTRQEIRSALPQDQNDLDSMVTNAERDISQSCNVIRAALQAGRVQLNSNPLQFRLFEPRPTHSDRPEHQVSWAHPTIDQNRNREIDRNELLAQLRNSINPQLNLLETRLRATANGLHQMESHPEHRGIMNLLHYTSYIFFVPLGYLRDTIRNIHTPHTFNDQVREYAQLRQNNRNLAIDHFMLRMRNHPQESIQDALQQLNETERSILIDDLQVQNWQSVLSAPTREEMIDAHLRMAENLIQGAYSTHTLSGGAYLDELLTTPWKAENYAMANNIVTTLENTSNLSPEQRTLVQDLRARIRSTNLAGIIELPRPDSLNEIWDFTVSIAAEIFILRGGFKIFKAGRLALGEALSTRGVWGARVAQWLGHVSTTTEGAANTQASLLRRGFSYLGRGLGFTLQTTSSAAGVSLATNLIQTPERHNTETDFTLHLPEPDVNNEWVNANLASLALAIYQEEHP